MLSRSGNQGDLHEGINQGLDVLEVCKITTNSDDDLVVQLVDSVNVCVLGQTAIGQEGICSDHHSIIVLDTNHGRTSGNRLTAIYGYMNTESPFLR